MKILIFNIIYVTIHVYLFYNVNTKSNYRRFFKKNIVVVSFFSKPCYTSIFLIYFPLIEIIQS